MKTSTSSIDSLAVADRLAKRAGILGWMRQRCTDGVTILMYHKVLPAHLGSAYPLRNLVVDVLSFSRQIAWLGKHFEVVTLRDAMGRLSPDTGKLIRGRRPLACVTFDDGYRDNFDHAAPILESQGLRGTFFVTTGFVKGVPLWFDRAALAWYRDAGTALQRAGEATPTHQETIASVASFDAWWEFLKLLPPNARKTVLDAVDIPALTADEVFGAMTIDQVRELADRGHEIGSHSVNHPILTSLDDASLREEVEQSRALVGQWTGQAVDGFCYPNGGHDERVIEAVRNTGYKYACVLRRGFASEGSDRMALPRRGILSSSRHEMTDEGFEAEVVGWHDLLRGYRKRLTSNMV